VLRVVEVLCRLAERRDHALRVALRGARERIPRRRTSRQGKIMAKLTTEHANTLLDKLSSDDAFREQFQKDPGAALKSIGADEAAGSCLSVKKLAPKVAIKNARDALHKTLTSTLAQTVHDLNAK
jgi:putative modified peptide